MKNLDFGNIRKLCSNGILQRGVTYFLNDHVFDFNIAEIKKDKMLFIESMVASQNFNDYEVDLWIDKNNEFFDGSCTCEYYESTGEVCKHLVAAYIKYLNEFAETYSKKKYSDVDLILEKYEVLKEKNSIEDKVPLKLEVILNYTINADTNPYVELKVGIDKTYVVRDMKRFLSALLNNQIVEFGKNFTLDMSTQFFNETDKKIIEFLQSIYMSSEMAVSNYYIKNSLFSGKGVKLLKVQVNKFLDLAYGKAINLNLPIGEFSNVEILKSDMDIEFKMYNKNGNMMVKHKSSIPFPLSSVGEYFFYDNAIYKTSEEQSANYLPIFLVFSQKKTQTIVIGKEDKINFASFVLPKLKELGSIQLDDKVKDEFYEEDLISCVYLDRLRNSILCNVRFKYGDIDIDPLKSKQDIGDKGFLVRNIKEEEKVLSLLKEYKFRESEEGFNLIDEEEILDFQVYGMPKLQEISEVYCSEGFKNLKIYTSSNSKTTIKLNNEDMLEFSFSIEDISKKEMLNVIKAIKNKKKYFKLKDNNFVLLEDDKFTNIASMIDYLDIKDEEFLKDNVLINKFNAPYIEAKLSEVSEDSGLIVKNNQYRELISSIKDVKTVDFSLPEELNAKLRGYQEVGYRWFKTLSTYGFGGILADEMGLGKTVQTIAFLCSEKNDKPSLVVCPTSLVYNWKEEFDKFAPSMNAMVLYGSKEQREEMRKSINEVDVVITSYPLIRRDIEVFKEQEFNVCIIDEAQQIKNSSSQNAQSVKEIKARRRFALTGTPIENTLSELWSIFDFVMPGYLLSQNKFRTKYEMPIVKNKNQQALKELNKKAAPFILRRLKKDVIKELPSKIEKKIIVELTEEQKKLYASYVGMFKNEIDEEIRQKGLNKSKLKILSVLTRLRQLCCDPSTFIENYQGESGKINVLYELLENSIEEGHKILVFSQFTSVLKNIGEGLKKLKTDYMYLDGAVKSNERMEMVNKFNEGDSKVFLISLKAGGSGLNLTSADVVIHFDPWWNPAVEEQATDRAHRIGQKNTVEVMKLVSKGTIEEKIFNLQEKKKEIINSVMGEEAIGDSIIGSMSIEEIQGLFS